MAELILSPLLTMFFEKLVSPSFEKLVRYAGIRSEVKKWEASLTVIRALLIDASQKEITSEYIGEWLNRLQHLTYDIDDVLDDLATEAMHHEHESKVKKLIPTFWKSFSLSTRMHEKLNDITAKLKDLEKEKDTLGLNVIKEKPKSMRRNYETSLVDAYGSIIGRKCEKEAMVEKLLGGETCNQNFNIVPIVGMGGIGKTTLARLLYNETQVKEHFQLRVWVCVSDEFDILGISKSIFESVSGENKEFGNLNLLQVALREKFMEKRFLLVLDDVWSESYEDWNILMRPFHRGDPGSKIMITTRKEQLLKKLGCNDPYHLQNLSYDDALSLFSQHALGVNNFDSHPMLKPYGMGIVKKCDGLPLALRALGSLLRSKTDVEEWKELLNSEIWRIQFKEDGIVPALRLSYHDLEAHLKQLFAYCSLFPKDYMFDKEELVLLWMAEGFLHKSNVSTSTIERLGHKYFDELLSRSFFQQAPNEESLFVMHDLMNDLARSVAGDFFLRLNNDINKDIKKEALEKYRHMSFVREKYGTYKRLKASERVKSLRTILAVSVGNKDGWQKFYFSDKILTDLLHEFPLLRVLCLSYLEIFTVPNSIGSLKHLRYLNLRKTRIGYLPENICNLYNLQTLIVAGCLSLTKLPNNFLKLKNLRHFDAKGTPLLKKMPLGIGELKSLQTLSKIIIGEDSGFAITEIKNFNNLRGRISIKGLEKVQNVIHARESNLWQKNLSDLSMTWSNVFDGSPKETIDKEVLDVLKPHKDNLKMLTINSYGGIGFPNWVGDPSYLRLTQVSIFGCKYCTSLPPLGQLPSLKHLSIEDMDEVRVVGEELLGIGIAFPSLEVLTFRNMKGLKGWLTNRGIVDATFPCLEELYIIGCPNLVEVSLAALPSLWYLEVKRSGHDVLRSLVQVASLVTELFISDISGLTDQMWREVTKYLGQVKYVTINRCDEIRYLWESEAEACKVLVKLRNLKVHHCRNLLSLGEEEEDNCGGNLTSLRMLEVWYCDNMVHCNCPNSIKRLSIIGCTSLTSISFTTRGQALKSLVINGCQKFLENEVGGGGEEKTRALINTSMSMLEVVDIQSWSNLKSIVELSCFIHLNHLTIKDCLNMESFPDHELPNLSSLKRMSIENCPSMDASFPRGLWPPQLCYLAIGGLKKPLSKFGPQNFPTSLVTLSLLGKDSEDVITCGRLSDLLPSSLTFLKLREFERLESLSTGVEHLTSLQHLRIVSCPKTIDLPETVCPSLLGLSIVQCPNLKNTYYRKDSYSRIIWPIPYVSHDWNSKKGITHEGKSKAGTITTNLQDVGTTSRP